MEKMQAEYGICEAAYGSYTERLLFHAEKPDFPVCLMDFSVFFILFFRFLLV